MSDKVKRPVKVAIKKKSAKVLADDCAEVTVKRGRKEYTVYIYAREEVIDFQIQAGDECFDVDGLSYGELDGE